MELLSPSLKKLWNEWQLQTLVLVSLALQIILILLGNRRKYINKIWIRIIVWPAYLMADLIATSALGLLTNRLVFHAGPVDEKLELTAFWAPFLLLHLGGPDTITAYSLEDNQLWSRHLLQLVAQTGFASYVIFAGWTGSRVSFLTIPMMLAGLVKYGERTWVLWSANSEQHRASTSSNIQNIVQALSDVEDYTNLPDDKLLQVAYGMFEMAKLLFAGVPIAKTELSALANHQEVITALLEKTSSKDAFKVTEMQLGFMYDMLYTKSLVTYTSCGIGLRFTSFILTSIVLLLFSLEANNARTYSKVDLCITFLLLAVAILLELYSTLVLLLSDHTVFWLKKHNLISNISRTISSHPLLKNPRWSNSIGQFSLFSYVLNEKTMDFPGIQKLLKFNEKLERRRYAAYRPVSEKLKEQLVKQTKIFWVRLKNEIARDPIISLMSKRGAATVGALMGNRFEICRLTGFIEFQQTIIVWHIATELCYHQDHDHFSQKKTEIKPDVMLNLKISKLISRYMMYLLVLFPDKLPATVNIAQINFQHTCKEVRTLIESLKAELDAGTTKERKRKILFERCGKVPEGVLEYEKPLNGSLLSLGCRIANFFFNEHEFMPRKGMESKWDAFAGIWMEFLLYAGRQCTGSQHAQQLSQGGEFLTHFWLLYEEMTALHGMSEQNSMLAKILIIMGVLFPSLRKLWNEWQLQTLVLLSLALQIILILLGNRRKYIKKIWITIVVWPAYLMADFIATSALGLLTNRFVYHSGPSDIAKLELTAFWAPFLLLHLGGPDTITAYSLEDNQLWSRHLLQLVAQTGFASYVIFAGWTGSRVSFLTIPMMLAGLVKYGERTWVIWSANSEQHRAPKPSFHNLLQALSDLGDYYSNISDDKLLQVSYGMLDMAKLLFAGVPISTAETEPSLSANHREIILKLLERLSPKEAFKIIEMQLEFMYDILYTKALVSYTMFGIALRFISFLLTSFVLVLFSLAPHKSHKYSKVDLCITFLLLAVAIVLELYATLQLLFSDHTLVLLRKHNIISNILQALTSLPLLRNPRWSNSLGQFNIVSYFRHEKPMDFFEILKLDRKLERKRYASYYQYPEDLKKWSFEQRKEYRKRCDAQWQDSDRRSVGTSLRAGASLYEFGFGTNGDILVLSDQIDFQQTIIVWHIATELCCDHRDHDYFTQKKQDTGPAGSADIIFIRKISKRISRYLMYLVAISPKSLPGRGEIGQINFKLTCEEGRNAIKSFKPEVDHDDQVGTRTQKERTRLIQIKATELLFEQNKDQVTIDYHDDSQIPEKLNGSLLSFGCKLANILMEKGNEEKWRLIAGFWYEFLLYAGQRCNRNQHAQQLRQGGEFLTHFWLFHEEMTVLQEWSTAGSQSD